MNEVFHLSFLFPDELKITFKVTPFNPHQQAKAKKTMS